MEKKPFGNILGVDVGSKRMGLALWDSAAKLARPLIVLKRKNLKSDLAELQKIISAHQINSIVVGLPLSLAGNKTESTSNAEFWIQKLKDEFSLPVYSVDESLSTKEAVEMLKERGINARSKSSKDLKDAFAAAIILEEFMNA